ncbi:hypothetical protein [Paraburkholderia dinghuensis]|uniref:hypothetical protein n=1 Tax=Paraburkholderia dinghuensis TaxID=2305225 RepID=UPI00162954C7
MKPSRRSRAAVLRDAFVSARDLVDANGVVNTSANDHLVLDGRVRVMVEIRDGKWVYRPHRVASQALKSSSTNQ